MLHRPQTVVSHSAEASQASEYTVLRNLMVVSPSGCCQGSKCRSELCKNSTCALMQNARTLPMLPNTMPVRFALKKCQELTQQMHTSWQALHAGSMSARHAQHTQTQTCMMLARRAARSTSSARTLSLISPPSRPDRVLLICSTLEGMATVACPSPTACFLTSSSTKVC